MIQRRQQRLLFKLQRKLLLLLTIGSFQFCFRRVLCFRVVSSSFASLPLQRRIENNQQEENDYKIQLLSRTFSAHSKDASKFVFDRQEKDKAIKYTIMAHSIGKSDLSQGNGDEEEGNMLSQKLKFIARGGNEHQSPKFKTKLFDRREMSLISGWYNSYSCLLDRYPLATKSVSAGIISALGDILSQWIEANVSSSLPLVLNWVRLNAFFISGTLFVGPYLHFWYEYLWKVGGWMKQKYGSSRELQSFALNLLDQTVGVACFFPTYFYVYEFIEAVCGFRAPSIMAATANLNKELKLVLLMQYKVWPITNWINFTYVPERMRVLVSNIVAIVWNAYLCAKIA